MMNQSESSAGKRMSQYRWREITNCGNTIQGNCKITLGTQLKTTLTQRLRQKHSFHEYYAIAELWFDYLLHTVKE